MVHACGHVGVLHLVRCSVAGCSFPRMAGKVDSAPLKAANMYTCSGKSTACQMASFSNHALHHIALCCSPEIGTHFCYLSSLNSWHEFGHVQSNVVHCCRTPQARLQMQLLNRFRRAFLPLEDPEKVMTSLCLQVGQLQFCCCWLTLCRLKGVTDTQVDKLMHQMSLVASRAGMQNLPSGVVQHIVV